MNLLAREWISLMGSKGLSLSKSFFISSASQITETSFSLSTRTECHFLTPWISVEPTLICEKRELLLFDYNSIHPVELTVTSNVQFT